MRMRVAEPRPWGWLDVAAGASSAAGAVVMAVVFQPTSLDFFYRVIPGAKSSDGPIFVLLAYLLAIPASISVFVATRKRWTRVYGALAGVCTGPFLMIVASAACAWLARFPARSP
jgi:hypothetical protein